MPKRTITNMKDFFQKQREGITIFAYVGVVIGLVYFVILPLLGRVNGVQNQIQEENIKQEIKKQQINELPKMENQYNILSNSEKSIDVLLDKNDAVALIERLEKMADDSGDKISISIQDKIVATEQKSVSASAKNKATTEDELIKNLPSTDYLQMKIIITGDYNAIVKFVRSLESFEYYCDIVAIQINKSDDNSNAANNGTLMNPFNSTNTNKKVAILSNDNKLEASLDVVFYTKK